MHTLNNRINLDRANSAADNISTGEKPMRNSSKKTPWHLRFAPGAVLRQIGLAVLALTMLFGVQTPSANAQIAAVVDRVHREQSRFTGGLVRLIDIVVRGLGDPYYGVYGTNNPKWKIRKVHPTAINGVRSRVESINDTLASDLVSAMEKYEGDIDAMTAREITRITNCLARNVGVKFPGCTQPALSSWDVHILFAIEELEDSVNSAVRKANSAAAALVSMYSSFSN